MMASEFSCFTLSAAISASSASTFTVRERPPRFMPRKTPFPKRHHACCADGSDCVRAGMGETMPWLGGVQIDPQMEESDGTQDPKCPRPRCRSCAREAERALD